MYPLTERPGEYVLPHLLGKALHTATNDVPDDHPLPFDRLGPNEVGTCLHNVLTTLVERDVPESTIRSRGDVVQEVFDETLYDLAPTVTDSERDSLYRFFDQEILDDFISSNLWDLIRDAEAISVEKSVDGLAVVRDIELEIHGAVDFVVEMKSGERHIADVKISLAGLTDETRGRYDIQVATYAYLFEQQQTGTDQVHRSIETFGAERETTTSSWPPSVIEHRLSRLIHGERDPKHEEVSFDS